MKGRAEEHLSNLSDSGRHKQASQEGDKRSSSNGDAQKKSGVSNLNDEADDTPLHFVYDKEHMSSSSRDTNTAWQVGFICSI